jgi:hypothetical protein
MRIRLLVALTAASLLALPTIAAADPPDHAPAHGYRAKHGEKTQRAPERPRDGVEIVFDSERGIHVAIGLPGVFFEAGHYYRERDGRWETSANGRDGWRVTAAAKIPGTVVEAKKKGGKQPGPAKGKR